MPVWSCLSPRIHQAVDDLAHAEPAAFAFAEDAFSNGREMYLNLTDAETGQLLVGYITRLPTKGSLYAVNASGHRTLIDTEYNAFDVGQPVSGEEGRERSHMHRRRGSDAVAAHSCSRCIFGPTTVAGCAAVSFARAPRVELLDERISYHWLSPGWHPGAAGLRFDDRRQRVSPHWSR